MICMVGVCVGDMCCVVAIYVCRVCLPLLCWSCCSSLFVGDLCRCAPPRCVIAVVMVVDSCSYMCICMCISIYGVVLCDVVFVPIVGVDLLDFIWWRVAWRCCCCL